MNSRWGDRLKLTTLALGLMELLAGLFIRFRPQDSRPKALPQDEFIQVYFNHLVAKGVDYTEPYREIERAGDNLEAILISEIDSATQTIDIAIQNLNLPLVAEAIATQHANGINVRVILEDDYRLSWSERAKNLSDADVRDQAKYQEFVALADDDKDGFLSLEETQKYDAIAILENAGVPILDDTADGSKGSGLMHHKFLVVDGRKVGSTSSSGSS